MNLYKKNESRLGVFEYREGIYCATDSDIPSEKSMTQKTLIHRLRANMSYELKAPLINAEEAAAFRKMAVQGATLKAWRVTSKSSNAEMVFS